MRSFRFFAAARTINLWTSIDRNTHEQAFEIFGVAEGAMFGHAITAKTAKLNKKLKMIELQLKKASLDQKAATKQEEVEATPMGEGKALDSQMINYFRYFQLLNHLISLASSSKGF